MDTAGRTPPAPRRPAFVEVVPAPASGSACVLEVEGPQGGRLRLQVTGLGLPDLVALSRVVWGSGA